MSMFDYATLLDEYLMYLRKSRQDDPNETVEEVLARHEKQLQEYALKEFGHRIDEKNIYREIVSGETIEDRPMIKEVIKRIENSNIKGVIVIEPSRLTRGDLLDCGTIVHVFRYTNTKIVTPTKTYDLEDKYDRKFFEMELTRGNDYLEYTKEILGRGRYASAHEGNYIGGVAPFGYDRIRIGKSPTLKINEYEATAVRLIYDMYLNDGIGYNEIANRINDLGYRSKKNTLFIGKVVNDILHNPIYIGKIKYQHRREVKVYEDGKLIKKRIRNDDCELIDGKHPAIISVEQFQAVKERKGKNVRLSPRKELSNIYSGILKCGKCGYSIGKKTDYKSSKRNRYFCRNIKKCNNISEEVEIVDKAIIEAFKRSLDDFEIKVNDDNKSAVEKHQLIINQLESELEKLEQKQLQLYNFLESGIYTKEVFIARNKALDEERIRLKDGIKKARETMPKIDFYKEKAITLHQAIDMLEDESITALTKNTFLKSFIKVIYYEKDEPNNRWNKENGFKLTIEFL